ncbi:hypothetical protein V8J88_00290 [Massilia sp. W12]|uniref:hypothetical protein n=1 Tax=Massilia sp. W12 TaxID=3126507 RepID=UPI0030CB0771
MITPIPEEKGCVKLFSMAFFDAPHLFRLAKKRPRGFGDLSPRNLPPTQVIFPAVHQSNQRNNKRPRFSAAALQFSRHGLACLQPAARQA